jgi:hypothetical protein
MRRPSRVCLKNAQAAQTSELGGKKITKTGLFYYAADLRGPLSFVHVLGERVVT